MRLALCVSSTTSRPMLLKRPGRQSWLRRSPLRTTSASSTGPHAVELRTKSGSKRRSVGWSASRQLSTNAIFAGGPLPNSEPCVKPMPLSGLEIKLSRRPYVLRLDTGLLSTVSVIARLPHRPVGKLPLLAPLRVTTRRSGVVRFETARTQSVRLRVIKRLTGTPTIASRPRLPAKRSGRSGLRNGRQRKRLGRPLPVPHEISAVSVVWAGRLSAL